MRLWDHHTSSQERLRVENPQQHASIFTQLNFYKHSFKVWDYLLNRKSQKLVLTGDSLYTKRCLTITIYRPLEHKNGYSSAKSFGKNHYPLARMSSTKGEAKSFFFSTVSNNQVFLWSLETPCHANEADVLFMLNRPKLATLTLLNFGLVKYNVHQLWRY